VPLLTKASNVPDHLQLLLARREAPLLVGNEPKGHLACSIPSGPLGREPVAASHEEKARTVLAKITERVEEPRPVLEFAPAADSLVRVPGYDRDVFALGPLLDGRALSLGAKALVLGTDAQIGDGDLGAARTSGTHD